ncbi:MAG: TetR/AcrR family transcriptional repressor of nem operon [Planctomycetota bacterium]|jgi:TetR/AcrR family transcriptional repressor of nem operon
MQGLVETMNIGRQSLYNTFGDKRSLFLKTLELYDGELAEAALKPLADPNASMHEVGEFLRSVADTLTGQEDRRSCFLMNSVMELAATDGDVRKIASRFRSSLVSALEIALDRAAEQGALNSDCSSRAYALLIVNTAMGLSLTWKSDGTKEELDAIVSGTISMIAKKPAGLVPH